MSASSFLNDCGNYEKRKVARDISKSGIIVSTAYTSDEGYETALIDDNGVHPVERYIDRNNAVKGHAKWLLFADTGNGKKVKELYWSDVPELHEEIILIAPGRGGGGLNENDWMVYIHNGYVWSWHNFKSAYSICF